MTKASIFVLGFVSACVLMIFVAFTMHPAFASTITTINGSDTISGSRTTINTNFSNLNTDKLQSGSFGSTLSIGSMTVGSFTSTTTATSSAAGGINLTGGCFAINSTCLGGSSGGVTSVTLATPNSTFSLSGTNPVTTSGTINADLNLAHSNWWTARQNFTNATTSGFEATSTNIFFSGVKDAVLSTNHNGQIVATTTIGSNYLSTSGVSAGSYINTNLTVNAQGIITTASNGVGGAASSTLFIDNNTWTGINTYNTSPSFGVNTNGLLLGGSVFLYASSTNQNTVLGIGAGGTATTTAAVKSNVFIGFSVGSGINGGAHDVGIGTNVFTNPSGSGISRNVAIGEGAMQSGQGSDNVSVGYLSMSNSNQSGGNNIAIGEQSLLADTSGATNIAIGTNALATLTTTSQNVAIGYNAMPTNTGAGNTAIGYQTMLGTGAGNNNSAYGWESLFVNTSGLNNTGLGYRALSLNTTGSNNVALGYQAGDSTTGDYENNTFVGANVNQNSGAQIKDTTAFGYQAAFNNTGWDSTFLGELAGQNVTSGNNNILIGFNALAPSATDSNQLNIGNIIFGTGLTATSSSASVIPALTGKIGIGTSSPWGVLSVASPAYDYSVPMFEVATSSDTFGQLFSIYSTSSSITSNASSLTAFPNIVDQGVRVVIGAFENLFGMTLDQFNINGRINTGEWFENDCIGGGGIFNQVSDLNGACGSFQYQIDTSGTASLGQFDALNITVPVTASVGAGLFYESAQIRVATATPIAQFAITSGINSGSTAIGTSTVYAGFTNLAITGTTFETPPSTGCYIAASSTQADWMAVCVAGGNMTVVDSNIPSTTSQWTEFRIEMNNAQANFYVRTPTTRLNKFAVINGSAYPAANQLGFGIYITTDTSAHTGTSAVGINYIRLWLHKTLWIGG